MKKCFKYLLTGAVATVSLLALLPSCTGGTNYVASEGTAGDEESTDFVSESIPFYKLSNTSSDVLYARFYNGERYIPYVSISYYIKNFDVFTLAKTSYSDGKYTYEYRQDGKSIPITVDVKNDTIYIADWNGFIEEMENEYAVTKKILKVIRNYSKQNTKTFDLKKYGMEIYGGEDDAYIPLCVLNQLFTTRKYKEIFYNGEGVYFYDYDKSFTYVNYGNSPWYKAADGTICERPQKLIDLTYNMLCFTHDYYYGQPGYYGFADDGNGYPDTAKVQAADSMNFDEMLANYAPDVQTMLKSSSYLEYIKGLSKLLWYTYGDMHAQAATFENYLQLFNEEQCNELNVYCAGECRSKKNKESEKRNTELNEARANAPGRTDADGAPKPFYVLSGGKTAVFTFDNFNPDIDFWNAYYDSDYVTTLPNPDNFATWGLTYEEDPTVEFYKILYKLLNDSTYSGVETILIDVSCNRGGDDTAVMKLLAYIVDSPEIRGYHVHCDTRYSRYISADLNLDGKIDDTDTEYHNTLKNKFKFAILSSRVSFSCGNAFPTICADEGIPVLGERSGGGACASTLGCTADGFPYEFSGYNRLSHKSDWSTIETGADITSGGEITAAADFYDDAKLQQIIDSVVK